MSAHTRPALWRMSLLLSALVRNLEVARCNDGRRASDAEGVSTVRCRGRPACREVVTSGMVAGRLHDARTKTEFHRGRRSVALRRHWSVTGGRWTVRGGLVAAVSHTAGEILLTMLTVLSSRSSMQRPRRYPCGTDGERASSTPKTCGTAISEYVLQSRNVPDLFVQLGVLFNLNASRQSKQ